MPSWLKSLLEMTAFAIVILVFYNLFKAYGMPKIKRKVNKWIVLVSAFIVFILGMFLQVYIPWSFFKYIPSGIFVILLLWFMDLSGFGAGRRYENKIKKDEIIMKPKAKPNRVKNNKE